MINKTGLFLIRCGLVVLVITVAYADILDQQDIVVNYGKQTHVKISESNMSRINVYPNVIKDIIGDTSSFTAILANGKMDLFITSKKSAGEFIDITLIYTSGDVVDLRLEVIDQKVPTIVSLNMPKIQSKDSELLERAQIMLDDMYHERVGDNYVQIVGKPINLNTDGINCIHTKLYRYAGVNGAVLEICNKLHRKSDKDIPKENIQISPEAIIAKFKNIVKLYNVSSSNLDSKTYPRHLCQKIYVIYKE